MSETSTIKNGRYRSSGSTNELRVDLDNDHAPEVHARNPLNVMSGQVGDRHWVGLFKSRAERVATVHVIYTYDESTRLRNWMTDQATPLATLEITFTEDTATYAYEGEHVQLVYHDKFYGDLVLEIDHEKNVTLDPAMAERIADEVFSIYRQTGFNTAGGGKSEVDSPPPNGAMHRAPFPAWNQKRLHDAMTDSFANNVAGSPQWGIWVFFAGTIAEHEDTDTVFAPPRWVEHDPAPGLRGIMFDSIGQEHREGCAIFTSTFTATEHANLENHLIRTAVHEIGHALNLAHSWQKELGVGWIPRPENEDNWPFLSRFLANDTGSTSFMNYPWRYKPATGPAGKAAYWANYTKSFDPNEYLFLRHAPRPFVQPGNLAWFLAHGDQVERSVCAMREEEDTEGQLQPRDPSRHLRMAETLRALQAQIHRLQSRINSINVQGRALTPNDERELAHLSAAIAKIREAIDIIKLCCA
eukprot:TRINITY_DN407_c0_g1_i1.p1 TRINITY_DN407_c0_g1~~TRINITY_DN407_c0_g1_i1.p1  ORF type:complete len:470 (+),score=86.89 TRINITY_DN407_c0_g1_i1:113-1522(+)